MDRGCAGVRWNVFSGALSCSRKESHQALRLQVRNKAADRVICPNCEFFCGHVSGAGSAFHGGGPTGGDPVAGEIAVWPRRDYIGTRMINAGRHTEGGTDFLDESSLFEFGFACDGKEFLEFAYSKIYG